MDRSSRVARTDHFSRGSATSPLPYQGCLMYVTLARTLGVLLTGGFLLVLPACSSDGDDEIRPSERAWGPLAVFQVTGPHLSTALGWDAPAVVTIGQHCVISDGPESPPRLLIFSDHTVERSPESRSITVTVLPPIGEPHDVQVQDGDLLAVRGSTGRLRPATFQWLSSPDSSCPNRYQVVNGVRHSRGDG